MFQEEHNKITNFLKRTVFSVLFFCFLCGIAFAADNAQFVSQTVPSSMIAGQTYSVTIQMRNIGSTFAHWNYSTHRLGSQNPQNNTIWGINRVSLAPNERIPPNTVKTFVFQVTAPAQPGVYNFQWRMVKESGVTIQWFGNSTPNVAVTVLPQYAAQFISQSVPAVMNAGFTYNVSVTMKNTGGATWTKAANFKLGSQNPQNNTTWGVNRVALDDADAVATNQAKTFNFQVGAPVTPGNYNFQWQVLKDDASAQWFGDASLNLNITVIPQYAAQFISQSVPSGISAGGLYDVSITMKNTGGTTWTRAASFSLGSQNPRDNNTWASTRVYLSDADSITTNQNKTFSFPIRAPSVTGNYNFQWRMLKEGVAWFGDTTSNLNIAVAANQTPTIGVVSPLNKASNPDAITLFTATYLDANGWQNLQYADLLFNTGVSGNNCVQLRYDQNTNKLYLRNDVNTAWLGGFAPGSTNVIENSYGRLYCASTTVAGVDNTLTVKWSVSFKPLFSGTKSVFPHVQDDAGSATGWVNKGTWRVNVLPVVGTITPGSGTSNTNQTLNFTTTYTDSDGWQDISYVLFLANNGISGVNCLYARYNRFESKLYLRNNEHAAWIGGYVPGSNNVIENSYAKINCAQTTISGSGNTLTVNWSVVFKSPFTGQKKTYLYAVDNTNAYNGWVQKGTWTINNQAPAVGAITPASGTVFTDQDLNFSASYSDPDTWLNIQYVHLLVNVAGGYTNCLYTYYNQDTNKLYLRNDSATSWLGGYTPGSSNVIENSYAKLNCAKTTVSGSGNTLIVNWAVIFKSGFSGNKNFYLYVKDDAGSANGWLQKGTQRILEGPKERIYVYLNGTRIAMEENGKKTFYHNDHLGGTNVVTDESGVQVKYLEYQPFGDTKVEEGSLKTKKKFTGKELDDSTGLYDYAARQYDAKLGRFVTADPIDYSDMGMKLAGNTDLATFLANPQNLNRYTYCLNNPVRYIDPDGLLTELIPGAHLFGNRKAGWSKNSYLARQLTKSGESVREFNWSGNIFRRNEFSDSLAKELLAGREFANKNGENFNVVAHSLGAVYAVNLINTLGIEVDNLITIGNPLISSEIFKPDNIKNWINFVSPLDFFSVGSLGANARQKLTLSDHFSAFENSGLSKSIMKAMSVNNRLENMEMRKEQVNRGQGYYKKRE